MTGRNCWVCGALSLQCKQLQMVPLFQLLTAVALHYCSIQAVLRSGILLFFFIYSGQPWALELILLSLALMKQGICYDKSELSTY